MKVSVSLVKRVFDRITSELEKLRFQKREAGIFTLPISNETSGWLGLNRKVGDQGVLQINPVVGVRNQPLEELIAKATHGALHSYLPPSISIPLGYLTPQATFRMWEFGQPFKTNEIVGDLIKSVTESAIPFIYSNSRLEEIYVTIKRPRFYNREKADYYIPALDILMGRDFSAREFVSAKLDEIGGRSDPAAERYRVFARAISEFRRDAP
jgi:hypothetical protein